MKPFCSTTVPELFTTFRCESSCDPCTSFSALAWSIAPTPREGSPVAFATLAAIARLISEPEKPELFCSTFCTLDNAAVDAFTIFCTASAAARELFGKFNFNFSMATSEAFTT